MRQLRGRFKLDSLNLMFIVSVIPLKRIPRGIPQILSYFSSKPIDSGVLVMVKIRAKETPAIVIKCEDARNRRIEIKRKNFEMKPINKIISSAPILTANQIRLGFWIAKYYLEPLTLIFKAIAPKLPKKIIKELTAEIENFSGARNAKISPAPKPLLLQSNNIGESLAYLKTDINEALTQNRQILILISKISLAEKISAAIASDFPGEEIINLSNKPAGNKFWRQYLKIKNNQAKIIVAARSGALLPFSNPGLIIIAEENSDSHKQREGHPLYDARDIAEKLAEFFNAKIIRESGIASIASCYKAQVGIYDFKSLAPKNSAAVLPKIIDMRQEQRKGNFSALSEAFTNKITQIIKEKKRAIFFINRRGAANFIICKNCGYIAKCPICQIPLVYYPEIKTLSGAVKYERLICNHCNFSHQPQNTCAKCKGAEIKYMGLGTQKIESQLKRDFPHLNVLRFDSDNIKNNKDKERILDSFLNKTPAALIATQRIFSASALPKASFVGIISLDAMLAIPDFRANERVFANVAKLITLCGNLAIQSYNSENPAIKFLANMDYGALYQKEIEDRRLLFYPPFSKIIKFNYRHSAPQNAKREALSFAQLLRNTLSEEIAKKEVKLIGPAPRFIFQEKGFYNWHIILKIKDEKDESGKTAPIGADSKTDIASRVKNKIEKIIPRNWEIDVNPNTII